MVQNAFYFDAGRCTGCKTCQVACKETYTLPVQNIWRRVYDYQGGSWVADQATGGYTPKDVFGYHVSVACNHCIDPICVSSCPTGAMQKDADTGIVWTDNQVCIGCRTCESVCPYGAPSYLDDKGVMSKCNMCKEKVLDGNIPICVSGCPMRALDFGTRDGLVISAQRDNIFIPSLTVAYTSCFYVRKNSEILAAINSAPLNFLTENSVRLAHGFKFFFRNFTDNANTQPRPGERLPFG